MRLACPKCDAQYELDDKAIPDAGRDVQCSNCGHAWFQRHPRSLGLDLIEDRGAPNADGSSSGMPPPVGRVTRTVADKGLASAKSVQFASASQSTGRSGEENPLTVLREEAEHEASVRRAEAQRLVEAQTEMRLPSIPPQPVPPSVLAARERFADLSVGADEDEGNPAARPASRRGLLPDVEEINSTLRSSSEPRNGEEEMALELYGNAGNRRGFRNGFALMMILAVVLWLSYVMAPRITDQIPASGPALQAYVGAVDNLRLVLDAAMRSATQKLQSLSGQNG